MRKYIISFTILMLTLSNVFFLYGWIDRSISLDYSNQSFESCNDDLLKLKLIVKYELKGRSKISIIEDVKKSGLNDDLLIKEGGVYLGNTEFIFNNNSLVDVE
ncbi:hypothetical protein GV764_01145 [Atlantibacter hermannii]|nr:Imm58 family immunity protein [Atlantibacter hermannii]NBC97630.1 hypothetical protein [Atlantibacter hermannii]